MSKSRLPVIGAFVVGGLLLFAVGLFLIGDRRLLFSNQVRLETEFSRVRGVQVGSRVLLAGLDAGEVVQVSIPPGPGDQFRVTMRIREDLHHLVRTDSVVSIQTDGLIGNVYLDIGGGTAEAPVAPAGSLIAGRDAIEFADLIDEGRETFRTVTQEFLALRVDISGAIEALTTTTQSANAIIERVGGDVSRITESGADVTESMQAVLADARRLIAGVQAGEGTIGRLMKDDALFVRLEQTVQRVETSMGHVQRTVEQVERAATDFRADGGPADLLLADSREVVSFARAAMSDLAENTEALKRNWLFRGFFNRRGFFNLRDLSVDEYRRGVLEQDDRVALRVWLDADGLFSTSEDGSEELTADGRRRIDLAMAPLLRYPADSPLVVEGYAPATVSPEVRFIQAQTRAEIVREHLDRRFRRNASLTGVMPMGVEAVDSPRADGRWNGVALAIFVRSDAIGSARVEP